MKISTLIHHLINIHREHGDVDCFSAGNDGEYNGLNIPVVGKATVIKWVEPGSGKEVIGIDSTDNSNDETVVTL